MRLFSILTVLFYSVFLSGQVPSINYYGKPSRGQNTLDFISLHPGEYSIFGSGYFEGSTDLDNYVVSFNEAEGSTSLSTFPQAKNQSILHVEPLPDNRYVVCSTTTIADQIFNDIRLTVYNTDGTTINSIILGGPYADSVIHFKVDENGNIYLIISQGVTAYSLTLNLHEIRKYNADLTEVYSKELETASINATNITTLPEGQLAVFKSDYTGIINGLVLAANGEAVWSQDYDMDVSGELEKIKSLFDGTNIILVVPKRSLIWTLDNTTGEPIDEESIQVSSMPSIFTQTRFLKYGNSYWLINASSTKIVRINNSTQYYNIPVGNDRVIKIHADGEDAIMLLTSSGSLFRFTFSNGLFTAVETFESNVTFSDEKVDIIKADENGITLGLTYNKGYFRTMVSKVQATETGEQIEETIIELGDGSLYNAKFISILDDKFMLIGATALLGKVYFWDASDSIRSSIFFNLSYVKVRDRWVDGFTLKDGRIIGMFYVGDTAASNFYIREFDPVNETFTFLSNYYAPFYVIPGLTHPLEGDYIGIIEHSEETLFSVAKVDVNQGVIWEQDYDFGINNSQSTSPNKDWIVNPATDRYLLGSVTCENDNELPFYEMKILDIDGNVINEFCSTNNTIDATAIFTNDDEIIVVSTDYNLNNQTEGEQYLLYYQCYDLTGNLLFERVYEVPYLMHIHELSFMPDQKLAVLGQATIGGNLDAAFIIMDEKGTITQLPPDWGQLKLGPSPSRDQLRFELSNEYRGPLQIRLLNNLGQQVRSWSTYKTASSWIWEQNLSNLSPGTYWVNFNSSEGQLTKTWVKQ